MMKKTEVYVVLTELFREWFANDDIVLTQATTAEDVEGWDSFNLVNIVIATEARFGIRLQAREVDELRSVGDLVAMIMDKTGTKEE